MLVENSPTLERTVPKRWNVIFALLAICAVATIASLRAEPNAPARQGAAHGTEAGNSPLSFVEIDGIRYVESLDPQTGRRRRKALGTDKRSDTLERDNSKAANAQPARFNESEPRSPAAPIEPRSSFESVIASQIHELERQRDENNRMATYVGQVTPLHGEIEERINRELAELRALAKLAVQRTMTPFSGTIRPGDILIVDLVGGLPGAFEPRRTVEPDGNLPLGAAYGEKSRVQVAGKTLIEAGQHVEQELRDILKEPKVLLTYVGHDDGVVASEAGLNASAAPPGPVVLAPLDTIEIRMGAKVDDAAFPNGMYLIEPDGRVALTIGRVPVAGLTEAAAGTAIRAQLAARPWLRKAPPSVRVMQRGRAEFAQGSTPAEDYTIRSGDPLLLVAASSLADGRLLEVGPDGTVAFQLPWNTSVDAPTTIQVAGLTLEAAEQAIRQAGEYLWTLTLGGWRETADPVVIDRIENPERSRFEDLERELRELRSQISAP